MKDAIQYAADLPDAERPVAVVLAEGTHVVTDTIELSHRHSNLTFVSLPGRNPATMTGAIPLQVHNLVVVTGQWDQKKGNLMQDHIKISEILTNDFTSILSTYFTPLNTRGKMYSISVCKVSVL